jgi:hypothetical protein
MKYHISILCAAMLSISTFNSNAQAASRDSHNQNRITSASQRILEDSIGDELSLLRGQVTQQTIQIKGILDTLCDAVKSSSIQSKELVCRELSLLREFIQNMVNELPIMSYKNLRNLIAVNNTLITQLKNQLSSGDLCGLCNLDASVFTTIENPTRDGINIEETTEDAEAINAEISYIQTQIDYVWNSVSSISLAPYTEAVTTASYSASDFINNNKGYAIAAAALAGTAFIFRNDNKVDLIAGLVERIPVYSLVVAYLLRQKKDKDITALANSWFGKDSYLANTMITAKQYVGSPKEKKPAIHITARYDMTLEEQLRWAEDNNCAVIKTEQARDCDFMKNFVEFEDGLFKLPLAVLFSCQVKNDVQELSKRMSGFAEYVITCLFAKK